MFSQHAAVNITDSGTGLTFTSRGDLQDDVAEQVVERLQPDLGQREGQSQAAGRAAVGAPQNGCESQPSFAYHGPIWPRSAS